MLDMHGGLDNLIMAVDNKGGACALGVMRSEKAVSKRVNDAEAMGEIIDINVNLKIPAATK